MADRHRPERDAFGVAAVVVIGISSIVLWPLGLERWALAKELPLVAAAALGIFAAASGRLPRWWRWWLAAAAGLLVLGAALGGAPLAQLVGRWPRYEGVVTLAAYALAVWLGARLIGGVPDAPLAARRAVWLRASLSSAAVLAAAVAALESAGLRPLGGEAARPGSLLGNASDLGAFGVVTAALLLPPSLDWLGDRTRSLNAWTPVGVCAGAAIVALSGSRGAMVALVLVAVTHVAISWRRADASRARIAIGSLTASTFALILALPQSRNRVSGADDLATASAANRLDLWHASLDLARDHPLTGSGASGFADAITAHLPGDWFARAGYGTWVESPHNVILQVVAAGGALGIALVVTAVVLAVRGMRGTGPSGVLGVSGIIALCAWAAALMTHFTSPGTTVLIAFVAGSIISRDPGPRRAVRLRPLVAAGLVAWAALLILALLGDARLKSGMSHLVASPATAGQEFSAARELRPWDPDLALMVCEAYAGALDAGMNVPAADDANWCASAVRSLPASTRALVAQAIVGQHSGELSLSQSALEHAAELSPTDPQVYHRLGGILIMKGDTAGAVDSLERARDLDPENPDIAATLAYAKSLTPPG